MYSPLSSDLIIEAVEVLGSGAVKVEPPVADEVVLVEESSVGAEEAVLGQTSGAVSSADVESLALGLGVRVVTSIHLTVTSEAGLGDLGEDGVILSRHSGDGILQHVQGTRGVRGRSVEVTTIGGLGVTLLRRLLSAGAGGVGVIMSVSTQSVTAGSESEG